MNYFLKFDIFSKRISFFFDKKEKIGSYFSLFLTSLYIIISLVLFLYNITSALQRSEIRVYDTSLYAQEMPIIELDKKLFYFAFGLEDPETSNRFIDETVYYPEVLFIDRVKKNGNFETIVKKNLPLGKCKEIDFGQNYQHLLVKGELNNSYCLKDFDYNITFAGGYKYEKMTYIRIKIFPCKNTTQNNNHCKPQEEIDYYFTSGYLSLLMKDIGLDPSNFTEPTLPTLQDLYTTVDRRLYRNYILNFGITEIHTDTGLFNENIKKNKYIQFRKELQNFSFLDEKQYLSGKENCLIQIRLDDTILIQKRAYIKISEVFSRIGGYMQLLYTIFLLISLLIIKVNSQLKIINSIFNFNSKKNKIILKFRNFQTLNSMKISHSNNLILSKKQRRKNIINKTIESENNNNRTNNNLISKCSNNTYNIKGPFKMNMPYHDNNQIGKNFSYKLKLNENILSEYPKNKSTTNSNQKLNKKGNIKISDLNFHKTIFSLQDKEQKEYPEFSGLTMINYFFPGKNKKKKNMVELFHLGINFYKKRMDIVFVFSHLLLTEKILLNRNYNQLYSTFNEDDMKNT